MLKEAPGGFDGSQVLFALILFAAWADEAVGVPDALQSAVAQGQVKFLDETARAEGGQLAAEIDDALFNVRGRLTGLAERPAGMGFQALEVLRAVATQPFAHGRDRGGESAGSRLDAVLTGLGHEAKPVIKRVGHFTNHVEVGDRSAHSPAILQSHVRPGATFAANLSRPTGSFG